MKQDELSNHNILFERGRACAFKQVLETDPHHLHMSKNQRDWLKLQISRLEEWERKIATDGATGFSAPPSGKASLPVTEGDAGRAPQTAAGRTLNLLVHENGGKLYLHEEAFAYYGAGKPFWISVPIPQPGETP